MYNHKSLSLFKDSIPNKPMGLFPDLVEKASDREAEKILKNLLNDTGHGIFPSLGGGDCFYDSFAQSYNTLNSNALQTAKKLRLLCHDYVQTLNKSEGLTNWIYQRFLILEKGDVEKADEAHQHYLDNVQYTTEEKGGNARWGDSYIDGRILCAILDVELHVIELHPDPDREDSFVPTHDLIDKNGKVTLPLHKGNIKKSYHKKVVHMANYNSHFVPVLPNELILQTASENFLPSEKRVLKLQNELIQSVKAERQPFFRNFAVEIFALKYWIILFDPLAALIQKRAEWKLCLLYDQKALSELEKNIEPNYNTVVLLINDTNPHLSSAYFYIGGKRRPMTKIQQVTTFTAKEKQFLEEHPRFNVHVISARDEKHAHYTQFPKTVWLRAEALHDVLLLQSLNDTSWTLYRKVESDKVKNGLIELTLVQASNAPNLFKALSQPELNLIEVRRFLFSEVPALFRVSLPPWRYVSDSNDTVQSILKKLTANGFESLSTLNENILKQAKKIAMQELQDGLKNGLCQVKNLYPWPNNDEKEILITKDNQALILDMAFQKISNYAMFLNPALKPLLFNHPHNRDILNLYHQVEEILITYHKYEANKRWDAIKKKLPTWLNKITQLYNYVVPIWQNISQQMNSIISLEHCIETFKQKKLDKLTATTLLEKLTQALPSFDMIWLSSKNQIFEKTFPEALTITRQPDSLLMYLLADNFSFSTIYSIKAILQTIQDTLTPEEKKELTEKQGYQTLPWIEQRIQEAEALWRCLSEGKESWDRRIDKIKLELEKLQRKEKTESTPDKMEQMEHAFRKRIFHAQLKRINQLKQLVAILLQQSKEEIKTIRQTMQSEEEKNQKVKSILNELNIWFSGTAELDPSQIKKKLTEAIGTLVKTFCQQRYIEMGKKIYQEMNHKGLTENWREQWKEKACQQNNCEKTDALLQLLFQEVRKATQNHEFSVEDDLKESMQKAIIKELTENSAEFFGYWQTKFEHQAAAVVLKEYEQNGLRLRQYFYLMAQTLASHYKDYLRYKEVYKDQTINQRASLNRWLKNLQDKTLLSEELWQVLDEGLLEQLLSANQRFLLTPFIRSWLIQIVTSKPAPEELQWLLECEGDDMIWKYVFANQTLEDSLIKEYKKLHPWVIDAVNAYRRQNLDGVGYNTPELLPIMQILRGIKQFLQEYSENDLKKSRWLEKERGERVKEYEAYSGRNV